MSEQDTQFLLDGYFAFSGYHTQKKDGTNRHSMLSLDRNNHSLKNAENGLMQCDDVSNVHYNNLKTLFL